MSTTSSRESLTRDKEITAMLNYIELSVVKNRVKQLMDIGFNLNDVAMQAHKKHDERMLLFEILFSSDDTTEDNSEFRAPVDSLTEHVKFGDVKSACIGDLVNNGSGWDTVSFMKQHKMYP
jgi:hypothetical protein